MCYSRAEMTIMLPPEIERALAEQAREQGTTPEQLALEILRSKVPIEPDQEMPVGATLYDLLQGYIGTVEGTGEPLSTDCGRRFTDHLVEKRRKNRL